MDLIERQSGGERHPWETARFAFFSRQLLDTGRAVTSLLDVGSGDAWFSTRLAALLPPGVEITCWDSGYEASVVESLAPTVDTRIRFTKTAPETRADVVLMLDVLEHVPDDAGFLRDIVTKQMRDGATLVFSVPAWPQLWSAHDARLLHERRYTPRAARALLEGAGLRVVSSGGAFHSLILPRAVEVLRERLRPRADTSAKVSSEWRAPGWFTKVVTFALSKDNALARRASQAGLDLPGLSWWAICEKA